MQKQEDGRHIEIQFLVIQSGFICKLPAAETIKIIGHQSVIKERK
jgi:hypothetical protein